MLEAAPTKYRANNTLTQLQNNSEIDTYLTSTLIPEKTKEKLNPKTRLQLFQPVNNHEITLNGIFATIQKP